MTIGTQFTPEPPSPTSYSSSTGNPYPGLFSPLATPNPDGKE